jgi:polyhydroxyalkanoate synthase
VADPDRPGGRFQVLTKSATDRYLDPDTWTKIAPWHEGSWWPEWTRWLASRSSEPTRPPAAGSQSRGYRVLCDAPGTYVLQT